jgi:aminopeptidase YwaD
MSLRLLLCSFLFGLAGLCAAQEKGGPEPPARGRYYTDTLASPGFFGRGYTFSGLHLSAAFIAREFESMGLESPGGKRFQAFRHDVIRFPRPLELKAGNKSLTCGTDFIPDPGCETVKGKKKIYYADSSWADAKTFSKKIKKIKAGSAIVFYPGEIKNPKTRASLEKNLGESPKKYFLIREVDKLTFGVASEFNPNPGADVLRGSIPEGTKMLEVDFYSEKIKDFESQNVLGFVRGKSDTVIVISAHYDHLGTLGDKVIFTGANDNASGVAMVLSLANYFSRKENKPRYSLLFIAFAGEEAGLLGSLHFVNHPLVPLKKIRLVVNLDILGTGNEGITVVNSKLHPMEFGQLQKLNAQSSYVPEIKSRSNAPISDHYPFSLKAVPALFIYTLGGIKAYHDIYDRRETLPLDAFENIYKLLIEFVNGI